MLCALTTSLSSADLLCTILYKRRSGSPVFQTTSISIFSSSAYLKVWFGSKGMIYLLSVVPVYFFFQFCLQYNTLSCSDVLLLALFLSIQKRFTGWVFIYNHLIFCPIYFHFATLSTEKMDLCSQMQDSSANISVMHLCCALCLIMSGTYWYLTSKKPTIK